LPQQCSWLPVDTLATTILELSKTLAASSTPQGPDPSNPSIFYNLVNPHVFSWEDLLSELHAAGLEFTTVSFSDWLQKLRISAAHGDELRNPAVKLIDYFEKTYGAEAFENKGITFETTAVQRDSAVLRYPPNIIKDGYVRKFLASWLQRWN
jgi:hypothetical protein